ncbi:hypothetical protein [Streptomyces sediminimaris]|uniref:hypothetical protein n=1 Tax=Streptomyces sediminimaris TaxID=3383721 RepID=UPI00399C014D
MTCPPADRFHLTLAAAGNPVAHGWWPREATVRGKFTSWVGSWGKTGARITLVDEQDGTVLASWSHNA